MAVAINYGYLMKCTEQQINLLPLDFAKWYEEEVRYFLKDRPATKNMPILMHLLDLHQGRVSIPDPFEPGTEANVEIIRYDTENEYDTLTGMESGIYFMWCLNDLYKVETRPILGKIERFFERQPTFDVFAEEGIV